LRPPLRASFAFDKGGGAFSISEILACCACPACFLDRLPVRPRRAPPLAMTICCAAGCVSRIGQRRRRAFAWMGSARWRAAQGIAVAHP